jgi:hypothetical protein
MWNAGTVPFMIVAILVATGPVFYATYHSLRYGHLYSNKSSLYAREADVAKNPEQFGWKLCTECKAVVVDLVEHHSAVHEYSTVSAA